MRMVEGFAGQAPGAAIDVYSRQREKSEAMRLRICEAAVSQLAQEGFHGASIVKVARRGGISQGALQHHYPTKDDLIVALADYLLVRSVRWFGRARLDLAVSRDAFAEIVRRSWREQFKSADFAALLEILVAARTDESLKRRITPALHRWREAIDAELAELLPATKRSAAELDAILSISRAMMTGLLIHDDLIKDDAHIDFVIDHWIRLAQR
ncbi:MAG: TetR/AcrR family transcriptional regulator [Parvularculaceae bacterium]|nr:TetR/AcrR family transcriptional regulator [Parvularculaceae bacterium]